MKKPEEERKEVGFAMAPVWIPTGNQRAASVEMNESFPKIQQKSKKIKNLDGIVLRETTRKEKSVWKMFALTPRTLAACELCIKKDFTHCYLLFTYTFNILFSWLVLFNSNDTCLPFVFSDFLDVTGFSDRHPRLTLWSILHLGVAPRLPAEWKSSFENQSSNLTWIWYFLVEVHPVLRGNWTFLLYYQKVLWTPCLLFACMMFFISFPEEGN